MKSFYVGLVVLATVAVIIDTVEVDVDCTDAPDLCDFGQTVKDTLESWYPNCAKELYSPTFTEISDIYVYFDPEDSGVAYTVSTFIIGSASYYINHMEDVGSMVHEMVHVVQEYPSGCPFWVTEGIADYYRYFIYDPDHVVTAPGSSNNWTDGYDVSAYFLNYIRVTYRETKDMDSIANHACREGTYTDDIWEDSLQKTLDELWQEMLDNER